MRNLIRSAITIRATEKFINWIKAIYGSELPDYYKWMRNESITYLIPCVENESEAEVDLEEYYLRILKHYIVDTYETKIDLSGVELSVFKEWFTIEYSVAVVDILNGRDLVDRWEDPSEYVD